MKRHRSGYTAIPGSAALPKALPNVSSVGLRRVHVHRAYVPVPLDVFDRLALDQEPEELAVYLHLWRLSVSDDRNGCRVSRAELERRVRMSQLRLGKALAGLVEKGHIALLDRNREGTLYRVLMPEEVLDRPSQATPLPPSEAQTPPGPVPLASVAELARCFLDEATRGRRPVDADEVLEQILSLVEDGQSAGSIREALARFLAEAPKKTPVQELPRYLRR